MVCTSDLFLWAYRRCVILATFYFYFGLHKKLELRVPDFELLALRFEIICAKSQFYSDLVSESIYS